jgi:hypothetical protein
MKHLLTCAVLFMMTFMATAQPQVGAPQRPGDGEFRPQFEKLDPDQVAQEQTDQLDQLVSLTPQQYKKLYKFHKKQAKERQNELENMMPQGRPEGFPGGGMGPGMGGGRPGGMGPGGGRPGGMGPGMGPGGMPPQGDGDFRRGPMNNGLQELLEEQKEQREKTYRKVLSADQYQKWESFEAQREFRQMVDTPR